MKITVNGRAIETTRSTLTFHDVLRLAFEDAYDSRDPIAVTYDGAGVGRVSGALIAGEAIRVVEGLAFTVERWGA